MNSVEDHEKVISRHTKIGHAKELAL